VKAHAGTESVDVPADFKPLFRSSAIFLVTGELDTQQ